MRKRRVRSHSSAWVAVRRTPREGCDFCPAAAVDATHKRNSKKRARTSSNTGDFTTNNEPLRCLSENDGRRRVPKSPSLESETSSVEGGDLPELEVDESFNDPPVKKRRGDVVKSDTAERTNNGVEGLGQGDDFVPVKKSRRSEARKARKAKFKSERGCKPPLEFNPQTASRYLNQFCLDKINWKFNKRVQKWLLAHAFDTDKLTSPDFSNFKRYIKKLTGNARDRLLASCEQVIVNNGLDAALKSADSSSSKTKDAVTIGGESSESLPVTDDIVLVEASSSGLVVKRAKSVKKILLKAAEGQA